MDQNTSTPNTEAGKNLGIAGMIVGIIAAIFSFIPCLGMWAIIPAIVGVILSAISMKQAGSTGSKGFGITGLITSIIGILIAAYWWYEAMAFTSAAKEAFDESGALDSINKAFKMAGDSLGKAMQQLKEITDSTNKQQ